MKRRWVSPHAATTAPSATTMKADDGNVSHVLRAASSLAGSNPALLGSAYCIQCAPGTRSPEDLDAANMNAQAVTSVGGSQSHTNLHPFLCVHFIIALFGIYPSRS